MGALARQRFGLPRRQHPLPTGWQQHPADYAQSDYNLPVANVTSLVYDFHSATEGSSSPPSTDTEKAVLGGWQISAINTTQGGTPFNMTYYPECLPAVSQQISATYRGANGYRPNRVPGQAVTQGKSNRSSQYRLHQLRQPGGIRDAAGERRREKYSQPVRQRFAQSWSLARLFNETDLDINKRFNTPMELSSSSFVPRPTTCFNHTNLTFPGNISGSQGTIAAGTTLVDRWHGSTLSEITGGNPDRRRANLLHLSSPASSSSA